MSGIAGATAPALMFRATINSATLPTISTSSVPNGATWIAHGVCKLVEAQTTSITATTTQSAVQSSSINMFGTGGGTEGAADSGTGGGADSGTAGYTHSSKWCAHYCARYCAHYCARYCARYCGIGGYGYGWGKAYGFGYGYGYGSARGYASTCTAVAVNGSSSWTQILPTGFTITTWLYYVEETNA
tara:strand:+ start:940 stop:1500 length:561 start_codon:yes stop_codon:yes gene_type:complete